MDVLAPELLRIGRCCYRLPETNDTTFNTDDDISDYQVDNSFLEELCDRGPVIPVEVLPSGRYLLKLEVSKAFWGKIIGAKGSAMKRLEEETRCSIKVPRPHQNCPVEILGNCERDVFLAKQHIDATVSAARKRMRVTHILSVPAMNDEVAANFERFKNRVLELTPLPEKLFSRAARLHWTLAPLVLTDNRERELACQQLRDIQTTLASIISGSELTVELRGVEIMNDDPSETSVLFAKCENAVFQELADTARELFESTDLLKDDRERVKLHVTIMNTSRLKDDIGELEGKPEPKSTFDATSILKNFQDFYFGSVKISSIHLSQLKTEGEDGYYLPSAIVQLHSH